MVLILIPTGEQHKLCNMARSGVQYTNMKQHHLYSMKPGAAGIGLLDSALPSLPSLQLFMDSCLSFRDTASGLR